MISKNIYKYVDVCVHTSLLQSQGAARVLWYSLKQGEDHKETLQTLHMIWVSHLFPFIFQQKAHLFHMQKGVSSGIWSWLAASAGTGRVAGAGQEGFLLFPWSRPPVVSLAQALIWSQPVSFSAKDSMYSQGVDHSHIQFFFLYTTGWFFTWTWGSWSQRSTPFIPLYSSTFFGFVLCSPWQLGGKVTI